MDFLILYASLDRMAYELAASIPPAAKNKEI
jgi:hypothetical protein